MQYRTNLFRSKASSYILIGKALAWLDKLEMVAKNSRDRDNYIQGLYRCTQEECFQGTSAMQKAATELAYPAGVQVEGLPLFVSIQYEVEVSMRIEDSAFEEVVRRLARHLFKPTHRF